MNAVYQYLAEHDDNPCVVTPTASGKSVMIAQIAKDAVTLWNGRVLILAHVKELLEQNAGKIKALCDGIDVGIYSAGLDRRDTDNPIIVAGIQSVWNKADKLGKFDVVIVDEVHTISIDNEDSMYRKFLAAEKEINPLVRVVGFTATPFRLKGGLICKPENIMNNICYEVGIKEMIRQGYLSPLIARAGREEAKLDNLHIRAGEFIAEEIAAAMDVDSLTNSACREIVELTRERKSVLIFTSSVEHCHHVADYIRRYSGQECAIVTGETPADERAEIIDRFKGKQIPADLFGNMKPPLKFLCNVNVLTTGFDAPNTDCVVLLRPTASPGLLIQMVGRGFRLSPETGKTNCLAEGTMILTDVGLVPIEKITKDMLLWDGVEFVHHDGAICKGEQNVITYAGLTATPDHKVYYQHHWRTFQVCAERNLPIAVTGIGRTAIWEANGYFRRGECDCGKCDEEKKNSRSDAMSMRRGCLEERGQCKKKHSWMSCLRQAENSTKVACSEMHSSEMQMRKSQRPALQRLWSTWNKIWIFRSNRNGIVSNEKLQAGQENANRQNKQQWKLRTGKREAYDFEYQCNEHTSSAQNKNASIQREASGNSVCRFNIMQSDFKRIIGRTNCGEVLQEVAQAKRRVWDILNAGPRHRFTANGLLVSNCLVLDFGGNIIRHGPIDMIRVTDKTPGNGDAPAKKCPECLALIHAAYRKCPECGYEFPPSEHSNLNGHAGREGILSGETTEETFDVIQTMYRVHTKRNADPETPKTMRIDYELWLGHYQSEWVCPEHTGYARDKFVRWWKARAPEWLPPPVTAEETVRLANLGYLAEPKSITVKHVAGEKFDKISKCVLGDKPNIQREPGEDWDEDYPSNSPGDLGVAQNDDWDIPF